MSEVHFSRNVFLDSQTNTLGTGTNARFIFQPNSFSVGPNEHSRMILRSYDMRRTWYDINQTNNVIYWYCPGLEPNPLVYTGIGVFYPVVIKPGSYDSFTKLATAIVAGMTVTGLTTTCTYLDTSRAFTLTVSAAAGALNDANAFFVSFYDDSEAPPTGVSQLGFLNDSAEIYGGFSTNLLSDLKPLFGSFGGYVTGLNAYISPFPAQLSSLEAIYIRCSLGSSNFSSSGFEPQVPNVQAGLNATQLWARIELSASVYNVLEPFVSYVEPSDGNFPLYLQYKQLDQMTIQITDDKGRDLSLLQTYPGQASSGALNYKLVFSWEVLRDIPANARPISLASIAQLPPVCRP